MASYSTQRPTPWLAVPRANPQAALRLFCFPYSGAAASAYYPWAEVLPPAIEVCPVQLPGRGTRVAEAPYTALAPLVEAAAEGLLPYLDRPFAFFGHSLGGLVAFEMARRLRRTHGLRPVHLFASACLAPDLPDPSPPLHALPEGEFVEKLRELNGMTPDVLENAELMELLLPILRADFTVCEAYTYTQDTPLDCPISAYGGLRDRYVNRQHLEAWRPHTTHPTFSVRMFPGDHFYLNTDRPLLLQALARELYSYISR